MNYVMKYLLILLIYTVGGAMGTIATLRMETSGMSFADRVLSCTIIYGAAIIGELILLGVLVTRDYLRERKTHRIIMQRLHNLGLPK